jgi:hypothetical protein
MIVFLQMNLRKTTKQHLRDGANPQIKIVRDLKKKIELLFALKPIENKW